MKVSIDKGVTWKSIKIPIGCYEIKVINKLLQRLLIEAAGGEADKIILLPNNNTLKLTLQLRIACEQYWVSMRRSTSAEDTKVKTWWIL